MSSLSQQPLPTPQKPRSFNLPAKVIKELKSLPALQSLYGIRTKDMPKNQQETAVALKYHGGGEDNLVSQVDKLIAGKDAYSELWELHESETSGPQMVIPQQYHRQSGDLVKGDNITKQLLSRTRKKTDSPIMNGRTIRKLAMDVTCEMKKMLSLMPIAIQNKLVTFADGEYVFDISGKTKKNFIEFIISQMYNWKTLYGATAGEGEDGPTGEFTTVLLCTSYVIILRLTSYPLKIFIMFTTPSKRVK